MQRFFFQSGYLASLIQATNSETNFFRKQFSLQSKLMNANREKSLKELLLSCQLQLHAEFVIHMLWLFTTSKVFHFFSRIIE